MRKLGAGVSDTLFKQVEAACEARGITKSDLVREALANLLKMTDAIVERDQMIAALRGEIRSHQRTIDLKHAHLIDSERKIRWLRYRGWWQRLINKMPEEAKKNG